MHVVPLPSNPALHMHPGSPVEFLHTALTSHKGLHLNDGSTAEDRV